MSDLETSSDKKHIKRTIPPIGTKPRYQRIYIVQLQQKVLEIPLNPFNSKKKAKEFYTAVLKILALRFFNTRFMAKKESKQEARFTNWNYLRSQLTKMSQLHIFSEKPLTPSGQEIPLTISSNHYRIFWRFSIVLKFMKTTKAKKSINQKISCIQARIFEDINLHWWQTFFNDDVTFARTNIIFSWFKENYWSDISFMTAESWMNKWFLLLKS